MDEHSTNPLGLPTVHTIPTHLSTADTVVSLGSLSLSSRQLLWLLVGGSVTASLWTRTSGFSLLIPVMGTALHLFLVITCALIVLVLTFGQAQGRSFDRWIIILLAYLLRPRLYLWRRALLTENPRLRRKEEGA